MSIWIKGSVGKLCLQALVVLFHLFHCLLESLELLQEYFLFSLVFFELALEGCHLAVAADSMTQHLFRLFNQCPIFGFKFL